MSARPLTLVLVDDHQAFRLATRELLSIQGHAVVGVAGCGATARCVVRRCKPDLVLVDVRLGQESGFALSRKLTREHPGLAVVLMSADDDHGGDPLLLRASGARAFVAKTALGTTDLRAIL